MFICCSISKIDERSCFLYVQYNSDDFQIFFPSELHCSGWVINKLAIIQQSLLCVSQFPTDQARKQDINETRTEWKSIIAGHQIILFADWVLLLSHLFCHSFHFLQYEYSIFSTTSMSSHTVYQFLWAGELSASAGWRPCSGPGPSNWGNTRGQSQSSGAHQALFWVSETAVINTKGRNICLT